MEKNFLDYKEQNPKGENMADFSAVRDQYEVVRGIWLKNPDEAKDIYFLSALVIRMCNEDAKFPQDYSLEVLSKNYRIVPNNYNNVGGCFVMFGDALAPGEQKKNYTRLFGKEYN